MSWYRISPSVDFGFARRPSQPRQRLQRPRHRTRARRLVRGRRSLELATNLLLDGEANALTGMEANLSREATIEQPPPPPRSRRRSSSTPDRGLVRRAGRRPARRGVRKRHGRSDSRRLTDVQHVEKEAAARRSARPAKNATPTTSALLPPPHRAPRASAAKPNGSARWTPAASVPTPCRWR